MQGLARPWLAIWTASTFQRIGAVLLVGFNIRLEPDRFSVIDDGLVVLLQTGVSEGANCKPSHIFTDAKPPFTICSNRRYEATITAPW